MATTGLSQAVASPFPAANEPETTPTATLPATLLESSCLAVDGPPEPLVNLVKVCGWVDSRGHWPDASNNFVYLPYDLLSFVRAKSRSTDLNIGV